MYGVAFLDTQNSIHSSTAKLSLLHLYPGTTVIRRKEDFFQETHDGATFILVKAKTLKRGDLNLVVVKTGAVHPDIFESLSMCGLVGCHHTVV